MPSSYDSGFVCHIDGCDFHIDADLITRLNYANIVLAIEQHKANHLGHYAILKGESK